MKTQKVRFSASLGGAGRMKALEKYSQVETTERTGEVEKRALGLH